MMNHQETGKWLESQLERPDEDHLFLECKICGMSFALGDKESAIWHVQTSHEKDDWIPL